MMEPVIRVNGTDACPVKGHVKLDLAKTIWMSVMIMGTLAAPFYASVSAVLLFFILTYFTLLLGHSVGMHRMMIHRTFKTSKALKRSLIFIGVMVGMGGPLSIIKIHDMRDWAQRQPEAHDFFSHRRGYFQDLIWQLFYRFEFHRPPKIMIEDDLISDPFITFFERHWRVLQGVFALTLFVAGGLPWVLWGVCFRVFISIAGHWTITYICHNPGPGRWDVKGAGVQAADLKWAGFLSHGECWHNNHHAFPESAKIGLEDGQIDPAWWVIRQLEKFGLAHDIGRPRGLAEQEDLTLRR